MSNNKSELTSQTPSDPIDNFADFLGKYTIVLNGTVIEKRADQPQELTADHHKEVVEKFKNLWNSRKPQMVEGDEVEALAKFMKKQETYLAGYYEGDKTDKETLEQAHGTLQVERFAKEIIDAGYRQQGKLTCDANCDCAVGECKAQPSLPSVSVEDIENALRNIKNTPTDELGSYFPYTINKIATAIHKLLTEQKG